MLLAQAVPAAEATRWTIANIGGIVVIVAVVALLSLLVALVKVIDRRVAEIRDTLRAIVANTQHTPLIPQTADAVDAVLAEGLNHHLFLGRVTSSVEHPAGVPQ